MRQGCAKRFLKVKGVFFHGRWFCGQECADLDPEAQQTQQMLERGIEFENDRDEEEEEEGEIDL